MKKSNKSRKISGQGGGSYAALAVLAVILLAVGGYFFLRSSSRGTAPTAPPATVQPAAPPLPATQQPTAPPLKQAKPEYPAVPVQAPLTSHSKSVKITGTGRLAIIIDDMGTRLGEAHDLADIGVPLTFSIIPGLRSYREVAAFSVSKGIETMIHIPMQPKEWPTRRLEANGLLVSMANDDIRGRLEGFLHDIPKAVGANNHMGSEFTEHADKMRSVLGLLQEKGLFFVDSVTSPQTVGYKLAHEMGIRTARRNVFLDNEHNSSYILGQLDQAVMLAKKNGSAIAICHPHSITIKTLANALPGLEKQGITIVPVSALLK